MRYPETGLSPNNQSYALYLQSHYTCLINNVNINLDIFKLICNILNLT